MVPDRPDIAGHVREYSLTGWIDRLALISVIEVFRNAVVQILKYGLRAKDGRFVLNPSGPPTEQIHLDLAGVNARHAYASF
jgi:hypothetical protein